MTDVAKDFIPEVQKNFVPFGYYADLKQILDKNIFFPIYLYGLSGIGKTKNVIQACAELKKPLVRVNLTENSTEDSLIGGFRLVKGETAFYKGPVIQAMELGAVLLLDEGDQAPPTVNMCLQSILEGNGYLIKQTGEYIVPKSGFTVVLAANTKGKGDYTGTFIGAQVQNEANLDRYILTFEHKYPPESIEIKILSNELALNGFDAKSDFYVYLTRILVEWANLIRKGTDNSVTSETMSTRRLIHFINTFSIFKDKQKALNLILNRYEGDVKISWLDLFKKVDKYYDAATEDKYNKTLEKERQQLELAKQNLELNQKTQEIMGSVDLATVANKKQLLDVW